MLKTIWKFPLEVVDDQRVYMPVGAKILTVQTQGERPCLWVIVDPEKKDNREARFFRIFGTGHPVPTDVVEYIGTFQLDNGALVFHVFEEREGWD